MIDSDSCPVCKRPIPERKLRGIVEREIGSLGARLSRVIARRAAVESRVNDLRPDVDLLRENLLEANSRIEQLANSEAEHQRVFSEFGSLRHRELSVRLNFRQMDYDAFDKSMRRTLDKVQVLHEEALTLLSQFEQFNSIDLLSRKRKEVAATRAVELNTSAQRDAGLRALLSLDKLQHAITEARGNLVSRILQTYKPVIQSLYLRFNVHPAFSEIDFEIVQAFKDSELYLKVSSRNGAARAYPPTVFSASQMNALAVSIFLALNLKTPGPLGMVFLDDPIQAMDDINVLGFCEVLRQLKPKRQMFISTHSPELYGLFRSKLRPFEGEGPLRAFWFTSWTDEGPTIREDVDEYLGSKVDLKFVEEVARSVRKAS
jgi:ABC-type lipoprotein export system ATPase subunit